MSDHPSKSPLTPERWAKAKIIYEQALGQPTTLRDQFVRDSCGGDVQLTEEVQYLLSSGPIMRDFLETATSTTSGYGTSDKPAEVSLDLRLGTVLKGRYHVQRRLGSGGIGIVYLAEDTTLLGRPVVVKFLHAFSERDPARLRKFRQEIEALARIDHPGVVTAFDAGEAEDGAPFLVMQYVEGQTLRQIIDAGKVDLHRAASILRQLGDALQAAHDKKVIHRDLKPENIMLQQIGGGEIVKLIDFGIARVEESRAAGETAVLTTAGTPSYMAPEQLSGRPQMASDVFAVGVLAFEVLAGKRPFPSKHPYQLRQQQRNGVPRGLLCRLRPDTPAAAEAAIRSALAFDPGDRPARIRDFCETLADALLKTRSALPRRSLLSIIAAAIALIAGVAAWAFWRHRSTRPARKLIAEHKGAMNPLEEGFGISHDITGSPLRNSGRTGFDRWHMRSEDRGSYTLALSQEEAAQALRRGWKITFSGYPLVGGLHAVIDFKDAGPRYDISLYRESDGSVVALNCTQHVPTFEGVRHTLSDDVHKCELVYDAVKADCDFYVDGTRLGTGYKGHRQQQSQTAFFFGTSVWKSVYSEGTVELARFELL